MSEQDELWGPWIEHDGKGCPVPQGTRCMAVFEREPGEFDGPFEGIAGSNHGYSWDWSMWRQLAPDGLSRVARIVRYRICKPSGMAVLEAVLRDLPEEVDA